MTVDKKNGDPNIIEACVHKPVSGLELGLAFHCDQGQLRIRTVSGGGLLRDISVLQDGDYVESVSVLQDGDYVGSINSIQVQSLDATAANDVIRSCVGLMSIRVKRENTPEVSLGDVVVPGQMSHTLYDENVIAADELDVMESGDWINNAARRLPRPRFISVAVHKATVETGISFINPTGNELIISSIENQSWLRRTPLKVGQVVHSINGTRTNDLPGPVAMNLLMSQSSKIRICAEDPKGEVSYAVAMVFKPTPRAPLGLLFRSIERRLTLFHVSSDGLFANSVLHESDKVIAINRVPCEDLPSNEALQITHRNSVSVTILVRLDPSNSIVLSRQEGKRHHREIVIPAAEPRRFVQIGCGSPCYWVCILVFCVTVFLLGRLLLKR